MTVKLGVMELPVTEDADRVRDYLNGTIADGGLWTALTRASNHDHTGGLNGTPISVSGIPDGSITADKLDPSVLLPYALTDGSKPFTGQVTMQADAVIRDTLYFGQQGSTNPPDAFWQWAAANRLRTDSVLGVGVAPAGPWTRSTVQLGAAGAVGGDGASASLTYNNRWGEGRNYSLVAGSSAVLGLGETGLTFWTAPSVAAGAEQVQTTRLSVDQAASVKATSSAPEFYLLKDGAGGPIRFGQFFSDGTNVAGYLTTNCKYAQPDWLLDNTALPGVVQTNGFASGYIYQLGLIGSGTNPATSRLKNFLTVSTAGQLVLTPNAGTSALAARGTTYVEGDLFVMPGGYGSAATANIYTTSSVGVRDLTIATGQGGGFGGNIRFHPHGGSVLPNADNAWYFGHSAWRWVGGYFTNGVITGSSADLKEDVTPLAPDDALAAVRATDPVQFSYKPPERGPEWYALPDDPEEAHAVLLQRMKAAPLEEGARRQAGFVLQDETGTYHTDPLFECGSGQSAPSHTAGVLLAALKGVLAWQDATDARLTALEGA